MRATRIVSVALAAALALPAVASAGGPTAASLRIPASFRTWSLKQDGAKLGTVSQWHVPLVATVPMGSTADLVLFSSGAFSRTNPEQASGNSLNGATDVTAQLFVRLLQDRLLLQAGAGLPTGKTKLTPEELGVAQALAIPVLGFRVKDYGTGFDFTGGASMAFPLAPGVTAGVGAGFLSHGKYTLVENGGDYKPGSEASVSGGVDLKGEPREGGRPVLHLDAVYRIYASDELHSQKVFQEGNQLELQAAGNTGAGTRFEGSILAVIKADNTVYAPSGTTVESIKSPAGTGVLGRAGIGIPWGDRSRLGLAAEWNHFGGSDISLRDGDAFGVGPTMAFPVGPKGRLSVSAERLFGKLKGVDEADVDLTGWSVGLDLSWRAGS